MPGEAREEDDETEPWDGRELAPLLPAVFDPLRKSICTDQI